MSTHRARPVLIAGIVAISAIGAATTVVSAASSAATTPTPRYAFTGDAFGSRLQATPHLASGRSAFLTLKCTMKTGVNEANNTESAQNSQVGNVGSVSTTTATRPAASGPPASVTTATVHGLNLLGGVIQATAIKATSTVTATGVRTGTTTFSDLRIDGHNEADSPKANQTYQLPGLGKVVLNAHKKSDVGGASGLIVNGLELTLGASKPLGLPSTTQLVLAHANAGVEPVGVLALHGSGYGSAVVNNNEVASGRTFYQPLPCEGTQGRTRRNSGANASEASALGTGSVVSAAKGSNTATSDAGTTSSTVHNVSLLGGMISATAIEAVTHVSDSDGTITTSEQGSQFVGLTVDGKKMPENVKPNTKISLGPLGTLWLNRVTHTGKSIAVHMIDVHLNKAADGVASGSDIVVANSDVGVRH
jgi:hypothetical protein